MLSAKSHFMGVQIAYQSFWLVIYTKSFWNNMKKPRKCPFWRLWIDCLSGHLKCHFGRYFIMK